LETRDINTSPQDYVLTVTTINITLISGFRRDVDEICGLEGVLSGGV
jgi:hypothetical protein